MNKKSIVYVIFTLCYPGPHQASFILSNKQRPFQSGVCVFIACVTFARKCTLKVRNIKSESMRVMSLYIKPSDRRGCSRSNDSTSPTPWPSPVFWLVKLAKFSDFSNRKSKIEPNLKDKHTIYFRQKIKGQTPISFFLEKVP